MKVKSKVLAPICFFVITLSVFSCKKDDETDVENNEPIIEASLPAVYKKFSNVTAVYEEGDYIVIETEGVPDHKSPYYQNTEWEDDKYEAYNGSNPSYMSNPNEIAKQGYTYKIPKNPALNESHTATPLGPIGVALNGVAIFNQYAAPGDDLEAEINTFDQYNGHPTGMDIYHYHIEPLYLTSTLGSDALIGFLLDGFPVYGPMEDGNLITNDDLDVYHGHSHATADYPSGIYHYHITSEDPYINGDGFYGTKGTVTH